MKNKRLLKRNKKSEKESNKDKRIKLRVAEALQDDAYRGIARIDFEIMKELGIRRGDIIMIKGERKSVAIVDKAYPTDVSEGIIRIDSIIRKNARTGVSENVIVTKADIKEAKKVIVAPAQKGIRVQGDLKPGMLGRAVVKGDILVLGDANMQRDLVNEDVGDFNDFFGDIFNGMGFEGLGGLQQIRFTISNTSPNTPCIVTENTEVVLSNKVVGEKNEKTDIDNLSENEVRRYIKSYNIAHLEQFVIKKKLWKQFIKWLIENGLPFDYEPIYQSYFKKKGKKEGEITKKPTKKRTPKKKN